MRVLHTFFVRAKILVADGSRALGTQRRDRGGLELPRGDLPLEEDVQLAVGPALGLREAEVGPGQAEQGEAGPEEAGLGAPVPGGGVQHARGQHGDDDAGDVVHVAGDDDGLVLEARRRELRDERVRHRPHRGVVGERVEEQHAADGPLRGRVAAVDESQESNDEKEDRKEGEAAQVDCASARDADQEPGEDGANRSETVLDYQSASLF